VGHSRWWDLGRCGVRGRSNDADGVEDEARAGEEPRRPRDTRLATRHGIGDEDSCDDGEWLAHGWGAMPKGHATGEIREARAAGRAEGGVRRPAAHNEEVAPEGRMTGREGCAEGRARGGDQRQRHVDGTEKRPAVNCRSCYSRQD
jgi:hypothetical protein